MSSLQKQGWPSSAATSVQTEGKVISCTAYVFRGLIKDREGQSEGVWEGFLFIKLSGEGCLRYSFP